MNRLSIAAAFLVATLTISVTAWAIGGAIGGGGGGGGTMSADDIMDAVQTVDGAASQLDADFLDGISSAGFCQVTGGADCAMSGGSPDITTVGNEDLEFRAAGTGNVFLQPNNDATGLKVSEPSSTRFLLENAGSNATAIYFEGAGGPFYHGAGANRPATEYADCVAETIKTDPANYRIKCTTTSGLTSTNAPQTCDCGTTGTPNTVTCDIQSDVVYLIDGDADACTVTISETTAAGFNVDIGPVTIIVGSLGGGGSFTIADSNGVVELVGAASFVGDSVGDVLTLQYAAYGTVDTWLEVARADNW